MTTEQAFLLRILADHLNGRKTEASPTLDWESLAVIAKQHEVSGMVYQQCRSFLPEKAQQALREQYYVSLFSYSTRTQLMARIGQAFEQEQIPFFTVKGLDVAALYPVPALRTMGDCDVVVHPTDKARAHQVMLKLGFESHQQQDMEWAYFKNHLEFELHDHLLYDEVVNSQISKDFTELAWDYARGDGCRKTLDPNFHFIFLLLHLKKHLLNSGAGFRQFMDLAVAVKGWPLDWNTLDPQLDRLELKRFTRVCFALCEKWFDVAMPMAEALSPEFVTQATEKILGNGIFGFNDETNRENGNLNALRQHGKLRTVIGRIFPSYRGVYYVPHYAFVRGRPWLLPMVWVYRWFRGIFVGKGGDAVRLISSAVGSDEQLEARKKQLDQWGL